MPENQNNNPEAGLPISSHRAGKVSKYKIEHYVAPLEETPLQAVDSVKAAGKPLSMWAEAWRSLRKQPLFIISGILILAVIVVAAFPHLFTSIDPTGKEACQLENSNEPGRAGHFMGFNLQGCDIYARVIFGTRASLMVGVMTTIVVIILGGAIGALAGFYGGWIDTVLARLGDIFFALPMILGAIIVMQLPAFRDNKSVWTVIVTLSIFGWPQLARITRGAVIEARNADFVKASRSLGLSKFKSLVRHVIPNSLAPIIVVATVNLGVYIVAEATLSFLGVGLPPDIMSWGNDIASAQTQLRTNPMMLMWPALFLSVTVLSFIMLGDAVRDALDPKARKGA
ncbi:peptide ABC transporter permease [Glutamicibacter uratoxydans]|uniref:Peptide ABC transporter permease n=1 Tax=Glutamicibacter uratoxydans TaxID=43667 RepID=A0A4Y4DND3_GLUUR|nr:ABC transporter permease [Glutamicibacter uratoxydans]GED06819.1 peptide ABC transporter permease [Glutamicibacter uratoxydans]